MMLSSCLQRWRTDSIRNHCPLSDFEQLSISENIDCESERPRLRGRRSAHLVCALFLCLALRVPLNSLADLTFFTLVDGQLLQRDNDTLELVPYLQWADPGLSAARWVYRYTPPLTEVVGGTVAARRGRPVMFAAGAAATSLVALLSPAFLYAGNHVALGCLLLAARLADALLVHNLELVWGRWLPMGRRWLIAVCYSAIIWGDLAAGMLVQSIPDLFAAPLLYYILGSVGLLMCVVWWMAVKRVPTDNDVSSIRTEGKRVSFCRVVMSLPVLSLIVAVKGNIWSYFTLETSMPACFTDVLHYEDEPPDILLLGQHLVTLLVLYSFIFISTFDDVSTNVAQKSYMCVCLVVNGGLLFLFPFLRSATGMMAAATTVHICSAMAYNSSLVNAFDIAPRFSPIIVSLLMAITSVCAPLVPSVVQFMTQDHTLQEWRKVFFISGGAALVGALAFLLFGSVKVQKWAAE